MTVIDLCVPLPPEVPMHKPAPGYTRSMSSVVAVSLWMFTCVAGGTLAQILHNLS